MSRKRNRKKIAITGASIICVVGVILLWASHRQLFEEDAFGVEPVGYSKIDNVELYEFSRADIGTNPLRQLQSGAQKVRIDGRDFRRTDPADQPGQYSYHLAGTENIILSVDLTSPDTLWVSISHPIRNRLHRWVMRVFHS